MQKLSLDSDKSILGQPMKQQGVDNQEIPRKQQVGLGRLGRISNLRQDGRGDGLTARHNSPQPDLTWEGPRKGTSSARRLKEMTIAKTVSDVSPKISNDLSLGGNDERAAERQQPLPAPSPGGEHVLQPIENQIKCQSQFATCQQIVPFDPIIARPSAAAASRAC